MVKPNIFNRLNKKAISFIRHKKNLIYPDAIILMYHRVADLDSDPWSLAVTPKHFAEHLEIIRKIGNPLSLQQLRSRLDKKQSVNRSIVITFDDGYADILYNAKPLLQKHDIPATVFVITSCLDKKEKEEIFWWDELEDILLQPGRLPNLLQLNIRGKKYQWKLDNVADNDVTEYKENSYWRCGGNLQNDLPLRNTLFYEIYKLIQPLSVNERRRLLYELGVWASVNHSSWGKYRSLTVSELVYLDKGKLIEIGAHSVSHPLLAQLPLYLQRDEIHGSKHDLECVLEHSVSSFSYPHGSYTNDTVSLVEEAGFKCACSSVRVRVKGNSNKFLLPRVVVKDCGGDAFLRKLSRIL